MPFLCSAEVAIAAAPADVFAVIVDLARYAEWNPWIVRAHGTLREGESVDVTARMRGRDLQVRHRVLTVRPDRELRWCDRGWFTALAYGERARWIEPREGGAHYRCELSVTGVGAALVRAIYGRALADGLAAETHALAARVEALRLTASSSTR